MFSLLWFRLVAGYTGTSFLYPKSWNWVNDDSSWILTGNFPSRNVIVLVVSHRSKMRTWHTCGYLCLREKLVHHLRNIAKSFSCRFPSRHERDHRCSYRYCSRCLWLSRHLHHIRSCFSAVVIFPQDATQPSLPWSNARVRYHREWYPTASYCTTWSSAGTSFDHRQYFEPSHSPAIW